MNQQQIGDLFCFLSSFWVILLTDKDGQDKFIKGGLKQSLDSLLWQWWVHFFFTSCNRHKGLITFIIFPKDYRAPSF